MRNLKYPIFWVKVVFFATLIIFIIYFLKLNTKAYDFAPPTGDPLKEPVVIRSTCYVADEDAVCSTGAKPQYGYIAGAKEWERKVAFLYSYEIVDGEPRPKELLGIFEVMDTGKGIDIGDGNYSIREGQSIDIYMPTLHQAEEWIEENGDYLYMVLIDAEG